MGQSFGDGYGIQNCLPSRIGDRHGGAGDRRCLTALVGDDGHLGHGGPVRGCVGGLRPSSGYAVAVRRLYLRGADGPSAFAKRTQKEIMAYLRDAGYAPQIDEDGDILFTYQELKCYISLEDGDEGELFTKTFLLFSIPA